METYQLCHFLDRRQLQHKHLDDRCLVAGGRVELVASMDLRLGWLHDSGVLRRVDR